MSLFDLPSQIPGTSSIPGGGDAMNSCLRYLSRTPAPAASISCGIDPNGLSWNSKFLSLSHIPNPVGSMLSLLFEMSRTVRWVKFQKVSGSCSNRFVLRLRKVILYMFPKRSGRATKLLFSRFSRCRRRSWPTLGEISCSWLWLILRSVRDVILQIVGEISEKLFSTRFKYSRLRKSLRVCGRLDSWLKGRCNFLKSTSL
mmetsp:Transcript_9707/g.22117  ORF Transcript_9707/g.22117 Transcript_9707/m.22117 type:complete len:200 (-) Transcript_9707:725-1324(-)